MAADPKKNWPLKPVGINRPAFIALFDETK
jgi:hypothetical protein